MHLSTGKHPHPLDPLAAREIDEVRRILMAEGLLTETVRVAYLGLEEPPKGEVLAYRPGDPVTRRARAFLLDLATEAALDVVVSIDA
ncbi:hypothetical protein AB0J43_26525, partial [Nonomuraea fuscirosea]